MRSVYILVTSPKPGTGYRASSKALSGLHCGSAQQVEPRESVYPS